MPIPWEDILSAVSHPCSAALHCVCSSLRGYCARQQHRDFRNLCTLSCSQPLHFVAGRKGSGRSNFGGHRVHPNEVPDTAEPHACIICAKLIPVGSCPGLFGTPSLLRRSLTSHTRASSDSAPRLPDAGQ